MSGTKRKQEGVRGVRVNPEIYIVEDADGFSWASMQHSVQKMPMYRNLPGSLAHIETSGKLMEQERPIGNRLTVKADVGKQGKTGANRCQRPVGVGLSHSSEEACEGARSGRASGAKGRAEQGTRRSER